MQHRFRLRAFSYLVFTTLVLGSTFTFGQGIVTGSISGTVVDPQGAVVPGANVRATQTETNRVFTTTSSKAESSSFHHCLRALIT